MTECLKNYGQVSNNVKVAVIRIIPKKKKCKREKWLSEEALQIAEKRREGREEKERYIHLNVISRGMVWGGRWEGGSGLGRKPS